jgi:hypothetical protein
VLYDRDLVVGLGASRSDLPVVIALFTIAAACGLSRSVELGGYLILTALLGSSVLIPLLQGQLPSWSADLVPALPEATAVAAGLVWRPMNRLLHRFQLGKPLLLAGAANALNLLDIALTRLDIHRFGAVEANPVVRLLGWPTKTIVVFVATAWLVRCRPRALIWPLLALCAVVAWHLGGIIASHP